MIKLSLLAMILLAAAAVHLAVPQVGGALDAAEKSPKAGPDPLIPALQAYVAKALGVAEGAVTVRALALQEKTASPDASAAISHLGGGNPVGRITFLVGSARVVADVEAYKDVVVAARFLRRNQVIEEKDLAVNAVRLIWPDARYVEQADRVIGKRVTRSVQSNFPVTEDILAEPHVVRQGTRVMIRYRKGPLHIQSAGVARDDGSVGASIRVTNTESKRDLWGRIVDAETVEVGP